MKHIAPQLEIRWDKPEDYALEAPKEVDNQVSENESGNVPHRSGDGPEVDADKAKSERLSPPSWGSLGSVISDPTLFD